MYNIENNFIFHEVTPESSENMRRIREKSKELAYLIDAVCPESREKSLALTNLEQTMMWANSSISRYIKEV